MVRISHGTGTTETDATTETKVAGISTQDEAMIETSAEAINDARRGMYALLRAPVHGVQDPASK